MSESYCVTWRNGWCARAVAALSCSGLEMARARLGPDGVAGVE